MGKLIELLYTWGFSLTNATLAVVYTFIIGAIAIKLAFFFTNVAFLALSVIRMKDLKSGDLKRVLFRRCAAVALFCILIQVLAGYNAIPTMALEWIFIAYWAKDGVVSWDMIRHEWESDWKPFFKLSRGHGQG
jgi:hypothetical protein